MRIHLAAMSFDVSQTFEGLVVRKDQWVALLDFAEYHEENDAFFFSTSHPELNKALPSIFIKKQLEKIK